MCLTDEIRKKLSQRTAELNKAAKAADGKLRKVSEFLASEEAPRINVVSSAFDVEDEGARWTAFCLAYARRGKSWGHDRPIRSRIRHRTSSRRWKGRGGRRNRGRTCGRERLQVLARSVVRIDHGADEEDVATRRRRTSPASSALQTRLLPRRRSRSIGRQRTRRRSDQPGRRSPPIWTALPIAARGSCRRTEPRLQA